MVSVKHSATKPPSSSWVTSKISSLMKPRLPKVNPPGATRYLLFIQDAPNLHTGQTRQWQTNRFTRYRERTAATPGYLAGRHVRSVTRRPHGSYFYAFVRAGQGCGKTTPESSPRAGPRPQ